MNNRMIQMYYMLSKIALLFLCIFLSSNYLEGVNFVLFTQPKTATHLLIPILEELTGKKVYWAPEYAKYSKKIDIPFELAILNSDDFFFALDREPWDKKTLEEVWEVNTKRGTFLHLHAPYSQTVEQFLVEHDCINIFVKRDPRDQIVSLLNHYNNIQCNDDEVAKLDNDNDKLTYMILKETRAQSIHFLNWLNSPICCTIEFEKLMGSHGEVATEEEALGQLQKMCNALGLSVRRKRLREIYRHHFGKGWSFFRAKVGTWREYLTEEQKNLIKQEVGQLLIDLGYEKDLSW